MASSREAIRSALLHWNADHAARAAGSNAQGQASLAALPAGRYNFAWDASKYEGGSALRFKVLAANVEGYVYNAAHHNTFNYMDIGLK